MDDQPLASSRVAWLQSRARRRMQESIGIYTLSKPGRITLSCRRLRSFAPQRFSSAIKIKRSQALPAPTLDRVFLKGGAWQPLLTP